MNINEILRKDENGNYILTEEERIYKKDYI